MVLVQIWVHFQIQELCACMCVCVRACVYVYVFIHYLKSAPKTWKTYMHTCAYLSILKKVVIGKCSCVCLRYRYTHGMTSELANSSNLKQPVPFI